MKLTMEINIRKKALIVETTFHENGPVSAPPLKLAAACAVISIIAATR